MGRPAQPARERGSPDGYGSTTPDRRSRPGRWLRLAEPGWFRLAELAWLRLAELRVALIPRSATLEPTMNHLIRHSAVRTWNDEKAPHRLPFTRFAIRLEHPPCSALCPAILSLHELLERTLHLRQLNEVG